MLSVRDKEKQEVEEKLDQVPVEASLLLLLLLLSGQWRQPARQAVPQNSKRATLCIIGRFYFPCPNLVHPV